MRRKEADIAYIPVRSLSHEASGRLISRLLKDRNISASEDNIEDLIRLGDGHPYNIYKLIDNISEIGIEAFISNPTDFSNWKHRKSSEYLTGISFNQTAISILSLLRSLPELDFLTIVSALQLDAELASEELQRLSNLHVVDGLADIFQISPALAIAVERDKRIGMNSTIEITAMRFVAESLSIRLEDGTASFTLVDSAILSAIGSGDDMSGFASAFLLPSHFVWVAKRHYDRRHWDDSIRYAKEALKRIDRLSLEGRVAACRYVCLPSARTGNIETFNEGMDHLEKTPKNDWVRSNIAFLRGFNSRLKGKLPEAEDFLREAYRLSLGNLSAARELAAICLARGNLTEAEQFAREAFSHAQRNPYVVDILLAVLIRRHGKDAKHIAEINYIFGILEEIGEEGGRSFFTTRKAEYEYIGGNNINALSLIEKAVKKTPNLFEPQRIYADILLKVGNKIKALEAIETMKEIVNSRDQNDNRTNYRTYLVTYSKYLIELEKWPEAKAVYSDDSVFSDQERSAAVRDIEITQSYSRQ